MQEIILIIILLLFGSSITRLSLYSWKWIFAFCSILGVLLFASYPFASEQSQLTLNSYIENKKILANIAVIITIETILLYYFKKYCGLLIFFGLFYLLCRSFFYFTGYNFTLIAVVFSLLAIFLLISLTYAVKSLIPEAFLRREIHIILTGILVVVTLIATSSKDILYVSEQKPLNYMNIIYSLSGGLLLFILGFFIDKLINKFKYKK